MSKNTSAIRDSNSVVVVKCHIKIPCFILLRKRHARPSCLELNTVCQVAASEEADERDRRTTFACPELWRLYSRSCWNISSWNQLQEFTRTETSLSAGRKWGHTFKPRSSGVLRVCPFVAPAVISTTTLKTFTFRTRKSRRLKILDVRVI